ncbi:MAG: hypothetical protein WBL06_03915 [Pseudolysinimonas sp.]|uniref:hypothetical protein n=1 Tax=Pseudolysinimonas sp. TaxID=2680009 RepID=UPI003C745B16
MTGEQMREDGEGDALLSRLKVIEDQPLETRAEHLAQVYEELRATLESGDSRVGDARPSA